MQNDQQEAEPSDSAAPPELRQPHAPEHGPAEQEGSGKQRGAVSDSLVCACVQDSCSLLHACAGRRSLWLSLLLGVAAAVLGQRWLAGTPRHVSWLCAASHDIRGNAGSVKVPDVAPELRLFDSVCLKDLPQFTSAFKERTLWGCYNTGSYLGAEWRHCVPCFCPSSLD